MRHSITGKLAGTYTVILASDSKTGRRLTMHVYIDELDLPHTTYVVTSNHGKDTGTFGMLSSATWAYDHA